MNNKGQSIWMEIVLWPLKIMLLVVQIALFSGFILGGWFLFQIVGVLPVQVPVSGASMLPTLPEEGFVAFQRYVDDSRVQNVIHQKISRGDIVVFENKKTDEELKKQKKEESGFVKRVVGTPGDTVLIKDGFVYVNGQPLQEQYTLQPRSTFGGDEVRDCQEVIVPDGRLFVLGDNRKVSMDSREIGLISNEDIDYYIPFDKQEERFKSKWRDATHDLDTQFESLFDPIAYVNLLNEVRAKEGLGLLKYQPKLEKSAGLRAQKMVQYDDFSFEATISKYKMEDAMRDAGYSNIVYGEFPMTGYYDATELFDAFLENPRSTDFLLNKEYEEIGVSTFIGTLNGCPVQVVVQHLAGYVPPDYDKADIESWKSGVQKLQTIKPGWEKLKTHEDFYKQNKSDVDRINEIIALRIARIEAIIKRMEANEWLNAEEKRWMEEDLRLGDEQNQLAEKLNKAN
jgi:signal peptidase I